MIVCCCSFCSAFTTSCYILLITFMPFLCPLPVLVEITSCSVHHTLPIHYLLPVVISPSCPFFMQSLSILFGLLLYFRYPGLYVVRNAFMPLFVMFTANLLFALYGDLVRHTLICATIYDPLFFVVPFLSLYLFLLQLPSLPRWY
jgi:hypothetical protein